MQRVQITYQPKLSALAPGAQFGAQTANHANSTSPSNATLSNTAAGYATLGGRFAFAAPAGAATDYALFAYPVPSTHRLVVDSVGISTINTGAAVATTATILDWSIGIEATAVSLATTDSGSTVFAPRRIPLGVQAFLSGAAIGAMADDLFREFKTPLKIEPGRYLHIIMQTPVGTATGSQVIRGDVTLNGYFEATGPIQDGF